MQTSSRLSPSLHPVPLRSFLALWCLLLPLTPLRPVLLSHPGRSLSDLPTCGYALSLVSTLSPRPSRDCLGLGHGRKLPSATWWSSSHPCDAGVGIVCVSCTSAHAGQVSEAVSGTKFAEVGAFF